MLNNGIPKVAERAGKGGSRLSFFENTPGAPRTTLPRPGQWAPQWLNSLFRPQCLTQQVLSVHEGVLTSFSTDQTWNTGFKLSGHASIPSPSAF